MVHDGQDWTRLTSGFPVWVAETQVLEPLSAAAVAEFPVSQIGPDADTGCGCPKQQLKLLCRTLAYLFCF